MEPHIHLFPDADALSRAAAHRWIDLAGHTIATGGAFHVALSGGSTPKRLFGLLASPAFSARVDWARVHIYFGDERCVPPDHPDSNYRMACEALLDHVPIPAAQIHRIPGEADPAAGAAAYTQTLTAHLPRDSDGAPRLDLLLLGMGPDGHTASLFPGTTALTETGQAAAVYVDKFAAWRITLAYPLLNRSRHVMFLVSGADKAPALAEVLGGRSDLPAAGIAPAGELEWYLDEAAAASLTGTP